jgi:hypothetical protein
VETSLSCGVAAAEVYGQVAAVPRGWRASNWIAVAEYIDWFNHRRLHGEIGLVPPAEFEDQDHRQHNALATVEASLQSLH